MKILKGFKNFIKGIKQGNMGFEIINKCLNDNGLKVKDIKPCHLKEGLNGFYDIKEQALYFDIRLLEKTSTEEGRQELYDDIYNIVVFML